MSKNYKNPTKVITGPKTNQTEACEIFCEEISGDGECGVQRSQGKRNVSFLWCKPKWQVGRTDDSAAEFATESSAGFKRSKRTCENGKL